MYEVSTGVRSTRNEDGGIVLDIDQGKIFRLNEIGALILERVRQRQAKTQIVMEVSREFKISAQRVEVDVTEFLESLQRWGLLQVRARNCL
ncbi:MAG: PqqD family protein [Terriglobales bacterium]